VFDYGCDALYKKQGKSFINTMRKRCIEANRPFDHWGLFVLVELDDDDDYYYKTGSRRVKPGIFSSPSIVRTYKPFRSKVRFECGQELGLFFAGNKVVRVTPGGQADANGVVPGMSVRKINNTAVSDKQEVITIFSDCIGKQSKKPLVVVFGVPTSMSSYTKGYSMDITVLTSAEHPVRKRVVPVSLEYNVANRIDCDPNELLLADKPERLNYLFLHKTVTLRHWSQNFRTMKYNPGLNKLGKGGKLPHLCGKKLHANKFNMCHDLTLDMFRMFMHDHPLYGRLVKVNVPCNQPGCGLRNNVTQELQLCPLCKAHELIKNQEPQPHDLFKGRLRPFNLAKKGEVLSSKGRCYANLRSSYKRCLDRTKGSGKLIPDRKYNEELRTVQSYSKTLNFELWFKAIAHFPTCEAMSSADSERMLREATQKPAF